MLAIYLSIYFILMSLLTKEVHCNNLTSNHLTNFKIVPHLYRVTYFDSSTDFNCSTNLGEESDQKCLTGHISIIKYSYPLFQQILDDEDTNQLVRALYIHIHGNYSENVLIDLDNYITTRPWWIIIHDEEYIGNSTAKIDKTTHIYLQRYKNIYEPVLRFYAEIQYPIDEICSQSHLRLGHMVSCSLKLQFIYVFIHIFNYFCIINDFQLFSDIFFNHFCFIFTYLCIFIVI